MQEASSALSMQTATSLTEYAMWPMAATGSSSSSTLSQSPTSPYRPLASAQPSSQRTMHLPANSSSATNLSCTITDVLITPLANASRTHKVYIYIVNRNIIHFSNPSVQSKQQNFNKTHNTPIALIAQNNTNLTKQPYYYEEDLFLAAEQPVCGSIHIRFMQQ